MSAGLVPARRNFLYDAVEHGTHTFISGVTRGKFITRENLLESHRSNRSDGVDPIPTPAVKWVKCCQGIKSDWTVSATNLRVSAMFCCIHCFPPIYRFSEKVEICYPTISLQIHWESLKTPYQKKPRKKRTNPHAAKKASG